MGQYFYENTKILWEGRDLSGDLNNVSLSLDKADLDDTAFGDSGVNHRPGLKDFGMAFSGFTDFANPGIESTIHGDWGSQNKILTIAPEDVTEDVSTAYTTRGAILSFNPMEGSVGEMMAISGSAVNTGNTIVRGIILASGAKTSSGNATGNQLGAVGAAEFLYASIHCTAVSGTNTPTIDVIVESDDNSGFSSATTRVTFSSITAVGAQWATPVAGTITDDYWRAAWTITGTNPSLIVYVTIGIQ